MMKILNQNKVELNLNQIKEQPGPKACDLPIPNVRSPSEIMTLTRLGSIFPHRLSFMRIFIRSLIKEKSQIKILTKQLNEDGYGHLVLSLSLGGRSYSLIGYTQPLKHEERTDRVIATKWDASFCLFNGIPNKRQISKLKSQVSSQEAGRFDQDVLTISRANKSIRLFKHVLESLASGNQPQLTKLLETGYLMRTTAVYGNGKFGIADRSKILNQKGLEGPFQVEMLTVFLIREFTFLLIEHCAKKRGGVNAVALDINLKRYLGIGNSTGLGMAPFLVNHPCLLHSWMLAKEIALARALNVNVLTEKQIQKFFKLFKRAKQHIHEWNVEDTLQMQRILELRQDLKFLEQKITNNSLSTKYPFQFIFEKTYKLSIETQELIASILIELVPKEVDGLALCLANPNEPILDPSMRISELKNIIACEYSWVSKIVFQKEKTDAFFWYTSQEKLEPRLGKRYEEEGAELEMPFNIPKYVKKLDHTLNNDSIDDETVAEFLLRHPEFRYIIRRIQNTRKYPYSEIRDNLVGENCRPIDLLRCKLAFFGASKFDPKSDRWTRITLFQGAPTSTDLFINNSSSLEHLDDWLFATLPT